MEQRRGVVLEELAREPRAVDRPLREVGRLLDQAIEERRVLALEDVRGVQPVRLRDRARQVPAVGVDHAHVGQPPQRLHQVLAAGIPAHLLQPVGHGLRRLDDQELPIARVVRCGPEVREAGGLETPPHDGGQTGLDQEAGWAGGGHQGFDLLHGVAPSTAIRSG